MACSALLTYPKEGQLGSLRGGLSPLADLMLTSRPLAQKDGGLFLPIEVGMADAVTRVLVKVSWLCFVCAAAWQNVGTLRRYFFSEGLTY